MKNIAIIALLVAVGLGGYWFGTQTPKVGAGATAAKAGTDGTAPVAAPAGKKLLYYRNPMGLPDTSPTPKKDSMGMDYLPVYEGEEDGGGEVKVNTARVQKLGVRTEVVGRRDLARAVRAVGRVEVDERRIHAVAPKFEGWIERLHVNTTGQAVGRGQPLFECKTLCCGFRDVAVVIQTGFADGHHAGIAGQCQQFRCMLFSPFFCIMRMHACRAVQARRK